MRSPSWMAVPDDDEEEEMSKIGSKASAIGSTAWFLVTSGVMLSMLVISGKGPLGIWTTNSYLSGWDAPWWLTAIFACEAYASWRRALIKWKRSKSEVGDPGSSAASLAAKRTRRLRHFTSMRLVDGAPVEELITRFIELDALASVRGSARLTPLLCCLHPCLLRRACSALALSPCALSESHPTVRLSASPAPLPACPPQVRSLELGSNSSRERHSRGHALGFMVTFTGMTQRQNYLGSAERAAFLAFAEPFVEEWFIFDFESGVVDSQ